MSPLQPPSGGFGNRCLVDVSSTRGKLPGMAATAKEMTGDDMYVWLWRLPLKGTESKVATIAPYPVLPRSPHRHYPTWIRKSKGSNFPWMRAVDHFQDMLVSIAFYGNKSKKKRTAKLAMESHARFYHRIRTIARIPKLGCRNILTQRLRCSRKKFFYHSTRQKEG